MKLELDTARHYADAFLATVSDYPGGFHGRGLVTCGGGVKYGACAWVLIRLLRYLGCELPIEVWCLNDDEFDPDWIALVSSYDVTCVNAQDALKRHPHRRLQGWELKPYAVMHSRFQEVLFLDADNVPVADPTFLFDAREYRETGTVFWPDPEIFRTPHESPLWSVFGADFVDSPDQESGQLLVDKARCWRALKLCNWYNEHSDFYYQHVYGDKETFRFAWQRLKQPISWPGKHAADKLVFTLQQHDFDGNVLFQHRFYRKWSLYGPNVHIPGFMHEDLCLAFLEELRHLWKPQRHLMRRVADADRRLMAELVDKRFLYDRPGHNRWPIRFGADARIEEGFGPNEYFWWCEEGRLAIVGTDGRRKAHLSPASSGAWYGERLGPGRMQINLRPL